MSVPASTTSPRTGPVTLFRQVTPRLRLLVVTMLVFNTGFYMVLPFLAAHLTQDVGLAAGLVGTVLGLRMLFQQGLFVVGGLAADRLGARTTVLTGIALRVVSFLVLAMATEVWWLVAAVVLLGVAGALFTPAVEALVASEADDLARAGGPTRTETFALYSAGNQVGTLVGPTLGAVLLLGGFRWSCLAAATVFALTWVWHHRMLPTGRGGAGHDDETEADASGLWRNRRFWLFAVSFSAYLAVYSQLYLAVPLELARSGHPAAVAGWMFTCSALLVVLLQVRVSSSGVRLLGDHRAVPLGFALTVVGALLPAAASAQAGPGTRLAALAAFVGLLTLGQMLLLPASRDAVARLARERRLGTHFGVVGSAGGVAVVLTSAAVGTAFDATDRGLVPPSLPWVLIAGVAAAGAVGTGAALRPRCPRAPRTTASAPARPAP